MIDLSSIVANPIVVGLALAIPSFFLGLLTYRRTLEQDKVAAQASVNKTEGEAIQRVIEGLDKIIENLQTDNREARIVITDLTVQLKECRDSYFKHVSNKGINDQRSANA